MTVDYITRYATPKGFDFPALINDDFVAPIRLLFQNKHYVSATKLLMSFIDSIGFIEYGESERNQFTKWLRSYADLAPVGITEEELWEHRNSLVHMSNLESRRVLSGQVRRLILYVGELPPGAPTESDAAKYFSFQKLMHAVAKGCERWFSSYNADPYKFESFVRRYDLIACDSRIVWVTAESGE